MTNPGQSPMITPCLFTRTIKGRAFSVIVSCDGEEDAKAFAEKSGMSFDGTNVHTIPCVPVFQMMMFMQTLAEGDGIRWKPYAEEQIEAFLTAGWPEKNHEQ